MCATNTACALRSARVLVFLALAGCGAQRGGPPPVSKDANFVLSVSEVVGSPEEDVASQAKVYVDQALAGETWLGPKSREKRWGARLAPGNHLFRCEYWVQAGTAPAAALDAQWQPRERFIRVEEATRAVMTLKFLDRGLRHEVQLGREPLAP